MHRSVLSRFLTSKRTITLETADRLAAVLCKGATMHEVRELARHSDIPTTELYFVQ